MNRPRVPIVLVLFAALMTRASIAHGQQQVINREAELKAKVVASLRPPLFTWPPAATPVSGAPLKIGVLGADPFQQGEVNHLDKQLAGQNVVVLRFATVAQYQPCQILVVSQATDLRPALEKTRGQSVLVIAQSPGLATQGAMVNLVVAENKVRMELNLVAVRREGLNPHPALLRMAIIIQQPPPN
jgi:hypothetical protein